jgi:hypothetical protein
MPDMFDLVLERDKLALVVQLDPLRIKTWLTGCVLEWTPAGSIGKLPTPASNASNDDAV